MIEVTLKFRMSMVEGAPEGISPNLECVAWALAIRSGLGPDTMAELGIVDIHPGTRKLEYLEPKPKKHASLTKGSAK